ncbi:MAG: MotA/TolQ/ExbB proton channel family protein [Phycisphaerales bacterium]|nr:MotA/TolQ/ExbB proton channel family protein [Phycisphaerales bacterium]
MKILIATSTVVSPGRSWWDIVQDGGLVGWIIIALSVIALALVLVHFIQIRRGAMMPDELVESMRQSLSAGDLAVALRLTRDPANSSMLSHVVGAGLERQIASPMGVFEVRTAMEDSGREEVARYLRSLEPLSLVAAIAPLLGLLGTVLGMVGAFDTISDGGSSQYAELAGDISMALVTTLLGLSLAIPCVAAHSWFRNRVEALASEVADLSDGMAGLIERSGGA